MPLGDSELESRVLRLVMAALIFVPLGFVGRFLTYYLVGSGSFVSSFYAIVGTLLSLMIFMTLCRHLKLSRTLAAGFFANAALLLFLHLFLWVPRTLTVKSSGQYLFLDGYVTGAGIAYYLPFALWESSISCMDFLAYSYLLLRYAKINPDGSDALRRRHHRAA
jgi:hypothetical protein